MDSQKRTKSAEPKVSAPKVLAVFRADCRATKGPGSTVAVVKGASGKCRLYGRNSLANAFPDLADICKTLSSAEDMAAFFHCTLATGKVACDDLVKRLSIQWDGREAVLADVGQGHKKRGGFRAINYSDF